jgi:hypothetical protein
MYTSDITNTQIKNVIIRETKITTFQDGEILT